MTRPPSAIPALAVYTIVAYRSIVYKIPIRLANPVL